VQGVDFFLMKRAWAAKASVLTAVVAVEVDAFPRTTAPHIFAAGDVIGREMNSQMATPVGSRDGRIAVHNALSRESMLQVDHRVIPRVMFTDPQAAVVGLTEEAAVAAGHPCWCNTLPMALVPRAGAIRETWGVIKMVADATTGEVLGVSMVGHSAGEIIHEAAMALQFRANLRDFIEHVLEACRTLEAYDLIIWRDDEARIVSAYPFSGLPTAHQVLMAGHKTLYAMCAIDALGIPFMLGQGGSIRSTCFFCRQPVRVHIQDDLLQGAQPSTIVVWSSNRDGCCVAEVRCPLMNFFCDEGHLHAWLATSPDEQGTTLRLMEALDVGKAAFGQLLA
jgi:hypothetical protein